ncbi:MAG TPA: methyl-accepting chemotaxis protein [Dongiaceae bacterium]|nr:methyl-accepting chemotaxis protein [Dongiaceae bacterium]
MIKLSNWKILYKLLLLVGIMSAVVAVVGAVGYFGIEDLTDGVDDVASEGSEALLGALINENALSISRDEFHLAADPSADTLKDAAARIEQQKKEFVDRVAKLKSTADGEQLQRIGAVESAYQDYLPALEQTLTAVRQVGGQVADDAAQDKIVAAAKAGRTKVDALMAAIHDYAQFSSSRSNAIATKVEDDGSRLEVVTFAIGAAGILGGILVGYLLASLAIARPVARSVDDLKRLSEGHTDFEIVGAGRGDEIGLIARTMQVFKENLIRNREMLAREAAEQELRAKRAQTIDGLTTSFDRESGAVVKAVSSAATEMQATAQSMTGTAEETARQATAVAAASEQASANVQTVATAAEELSTSVQEITRQVAESTRVAGEAVSEAAKSGGLVKALAEAAQRIGAVVNLINEIAGQTNLLALNATIEAARAGDAGKGFAVVASEVKSLATQTAKATEEIGSQVESIQQATGDAVRSIDGISGIIGRINEITTAIAAAVEEQGAATQEIARNVQQAAQGTQEVSSSVATVTEAAQHTGAAATQLRGASADLSTQAETMRSQVETFIAAIKAA